MKSEMTTVVVDRVQTAGELFAALFPDADPGDYHVRILKHAGPTALARDDALMPGDRVTVRKAAFKRIKWRTGG